MESHGGRITYSSDGADFPLQIIRGGNGSKNPKQTTTDCKMMLLEETKSNQILAVLQQSRNDASSWHIFSFQPCYPGQLPPCKDDKANNQCPGKPLYEWAIVKQEHSMGASGGGYCLYSRDPKTSASYFAQKASRQGGFIKIRRGKTFCALIGPTRKIAAAAQKQQRQSPSASSSSSSSSGYRNVKIAPGIDPALLLCYTAIIGVMSTTRKQTRTNRLENGTEIIDAMTDLVDAFQ